MLTTSSKKKNHNTNLHFSNCVDYYFKNVNSTNTKNQICRYNKGNSWKQHSESTSDFKRPILEKNRHTNNMVNRKLLL